jgi:hypothetical protein
MEAEFTVKINEDLIRKAESYASRKTTLLVGGAAIVALTAFVLRICREEQGWGIVLWLLVVLVVWLIVRRVMRSKSGGQSPYGEFDIIYRLADDGLHYSTPFSTGVYPYKVMQRLKRFPDLWVIYETRETVIPLPTDKLAPEVREFIVSKVREHGGKVQGK